MNDSASRERASYSKTVWLSVTAALVLAAAAAALCLSRGSLFAHALAWAAGLGALACTALAASGAVVIVRYARAQRGASDLYLQANTSRQAEALVRPDGFRAGPLRRLLARAMLGHDVLVGDEVRVRSLEEIVATLDERGCLGGMPFQPEMARYCGQPARVFRSVDKILDYGRTREMRRLRGCVLLAGLRCSGSEHGDCQARCYILWRTEWLRRPGQEAPAAAVAGFGQGRVAPPKGMETLADGTQRERFHCQFTQLHTASAPMGAWEIGKELRPLVAGNVTLRAWTVGMATRLFNVAQARRGGSGYPAMPPRLKPAVPIQPQPLAPSDAVVVRSGVEIAGTLNDRNKHRGLWFDRDQLKYSGQTRRVLARVERIIDDVHGQLRPMKTPCILLEGVDYSGESLFFSAQHDLFFWREDWLRKVAPPAVETQDGRTDRHVSQ